MSDAAIITDLPCVISTKANQSQFIRPPDENS